MPSPLPESQPHPAPTARADPDASSADPFFLFHNYPTDDRIRQVPCSPRRAPVHPRRDREARGPLFGDVIKCGDVIFGDVIKCGDVIKRVLPACSSALLCCAGDARVPAPPPPLVLIGHAASLTLY